jgi:vacuolar-type H+-ATPase subunit E/Vma4
MALKDILEKIEEETSKKLAVLEENLKTKIKKLEEDFERRQKEIDKNTHNKVEENSAKILEKAEMLAVMESKNKLLRAKRGLIETALEKAIDQLFEDKNYEDVISKMLKKVDLEGEDIVIIPSKGKEEETKKAIKASGKNFFLSEKPENIKGGFIVKTSKIEIDNSFETLIKKQLKEDLEIDINKLLF